MGRLINSCFSVKKFENSNDKDFYKALKIYNDTISVDTKTSSNEITYFVDNQNIQDSRTMYFLGLYFNNEIVGYVEAGYLHKTKSIIIDYIVLKPEYHLNSVFYPLFGLVQKFFSDELIDYNYIITEVSTKCVGDADSESFFSKKMLQLEDFRIANGLYLQPKLGIYNSESNFEFELLIRSKQALSKIKTDTYLMIVKDIYYNHYLAWYSEIEQQHKENYKKHIDEQLKKITEAVRKEEYIVLTPSSPICEYYKSSECHFNSSTAGYIDDKEPKNRPVLLIGIPILLVVEIVLGILVLKALSFFKIDLVTFTPLLVVITTLCTCIFTLAFSKNKH